MIDLSAPNHNSRVTYRLEIRLSAELAQSFRKYCTDTDLPDSAAGRRLLREALQMYGDGYERWAHAREILEGEEGSGLSG